MTNLIGRRVRLAFPGYQKHVDDMLTKGQSREHTLKNAVGNMHHWMITYLDQEAEIVAAIPDGDSSLKFSYAFADGVVQHGYLTDFIILPEVKQVQGYEMHSLIAEADAADTLEELNDLGKLGWQLISVVGSIGDSAVFYFQRLRK